MKLTLSAITLSLLTNMQHTAAFVARKSLLSSTRASSSAAYSRTAALFAEKGQAEVVLVGCGAPNRGMGWYHAVQMLDKK